MILLVHLLLGAAIGSAVNNILLAIILALLSHYFLDLIPHIEYPIENITKKQWRQALPDILKVILDFCFGIMLIFIFSKNSALIYVCALVAILPDGITVLNYIAPNKLSKGNDILHKKMHFLGEKKLPVFWRVTSQVIVVITSVLLMKI